MDERDTIDVESGDVLGPYAQRGAGRDDIEIDRTPTPVAPCPRCGRPAPVRSPHIQVGIGGVRIYCSAECLQGLAIPVEETPLPAAPPRKRWGGRLMLGVGIVGAILVPHARKLPSPASVAPPAVMSGMNIHSGAKAVPEPPPPPKYGPPWPPTDAEVVTELAQDAWFHPLSGPDRRMPISDGRVFGAERPGERPAEWRSGHCGVDIGGEQWGESVMVAHDGVIDRVVRGPNEEHGGLYVRVAHRNGTVFTQYFHLAAIPRKLVPGMPVRAGDVIGLLGDTGVKESKPHLHFTVSVKPSAELPERYIDPEPLIALWPIRMGTGHVVGIVADAKPGFPRGASGRKKKTAHARPHKAELPDVNSSSPEEPPAAD
jgi:peptidase M23-like protein